MYFLCHKYLSMKNYHQMIYISYTNVQMIWDLPSCLNDKDTLAKRRAQNEQIEKILLKSIIYICFLKYFLRDNKIVLKLNFNIFAPIKKN